MPFQRGATHRSGSCCKPVLPPCCRPKTSTPRPPRPPTSMFGLESEYVDLDDEEDVPAEVAAAMLHSEEQGFVMHSEPARIYNTLFHDPNELMIVTSASPQPMQDVVVPADNEELPHTPSRVNLAASTSVSQREQSVPSTSLFTDKMKQLGLYDSVMATAGSVVADGEEDIDMLVDSTSYCSLAETLSRDNLEVVLDTALPAHFSQVQLRGSVSPTWFPGYFEALPTIPGMTSVTSSPMTVIQDAWQTIDAA